VTVLITSGPVMNMCEVSRTIRMKSVIARRVDRTARAGTMISEICGITPEQRTLR